MSFPAGGRRPGRARQVGDPAAPARSGYVPPGWPPGVHPPAVEGWEQTAVEWMLDWGAPEWRLPGNEVLRNHPLVLAWLFRQWTAANLQAAREGWSSLRRAEDAPDPAAHEKHLRGLADVGRQLRARAQGAELIERAMTGELFVPRL